MRCFEVEGLPAWRLCPRWLGFRGSGFGCRVQGLRAFHGCHAHPRVPCLFSKAGERVAAIPNCRLHSRCSCRYCFNPSKSRRWSGVVSSRWAWKTGNLHPVNFIRSLYSWEQTTWWSGSLRGVARVLHSCETCCCRRIRKAVWVYLRISKPCGCLHVNSMKL